MVCSTCNTTNLEFNTSNCCPTSKVTSIKQVDKELYITLDNCVVMKAPITALDKTSFLGDTFYVTDVDMKDKMLQVTKQNVYTKETIVKQVTLPENEPKQVLSNLVALLRGNDNTTNLGYTVNKGNNND